VFWGCREVGNAAELFVTRSAVIQVRSAGGEHAPVMSSGTANSPRISLLRPGRTRQCAAQVGNEEYYSNILTFIRLNFFLASTKFEKRISQLWSRVKSHRKFCT
jgi:hypothetical protein